MKGCSYAVHLDDFDDPSEAEVTDEEENEQELDNDE